MIPLVFVALALATPSEDALAPVPRAIWDQALAAEKVGDVAMAARLYERVLELDPAFTEAILAWGRVLEVQQSWDEAEAVYRRAPSDADALEALGRLYLAQERYEPALATFGRLQELDAAEPEYVRLEVRALAAVNAAAANERFRAYLQLSGVEPGDASVAEVGAAVAAALEAAGEDEAALQLLQELAGLPGGEAAAELYAEQLDELTVRHQARELAESGALPLSTVQRSTLDAARRQLASGEVEAALTSLRQLTDAAPRNAEVHAALSRAYDAAGDLSSAEQEAWMATRLAPLQATHTIHYADLLVSAYGGRRDAEAADLYAKAGLQQGATPEVWFRQGAALLRSGDADAAARAFEHYLSLDPHGTRAEEARRAVEGYRRIAPERPPAPLGSSRPPNVPVDAWLLYHEAVVYQQRSSDKRDQDLERALERLSSARAIAPGFAGIDSLEARIRTEQGDFGAAISAWERALEKVPDQPDTMVELAALLQREGQAERAREWLERAAGLGASDALLTLAEEALQRGDFQDAEALLDAYFAGPGSALTRDRAVAVAEEARRARWTRRVAMASLGALALAIPAVWLARRRSGWTVEEWMEHTPRARHDVARITAAIRHEVLKHHTTVLPAVADALEAGDDDTAVWTADRLLGRAGALSRFRSYVRDLEDIAAQSGHRLNLTRRDPVFGPLTAAMRRLEHLARQLSTRPSPALARPIREVSKTVNVDAYRALQRLIRRASLVTVDQEFVRQLWDRIRSELDPHRAGGIRLVSVPSRDPALHVRIWRPELEDILGNLLRNAIAAVLENGGDRVGIALGVETDETTLVERAEIRVLDAAPRRLNTAMIRGRYIDRGLGLVVDLVSKNGGSVHVQDESGEWTKAVVVRLPLMEAVS